MKTKSSLLLIVLVLFTVQLTRGQSAGNAVTDLLLSAYSPRNFTAEPVTDQQLDLILKCGIKAPSGRNLQPWRFTVVRDEPSMKDIIGNAVAGNVLILVSGPETQERGTPDFDCGTGHTEYVHSSHLTGSGCKDIRRADSRCQRQA